MGLTSEFAALGAVVAAFAGVLAGRSFGPLFFGLAGFLFFTMIGLLLASIFFRLVQEDGPEAGGVGGAAIAAAVVVAVGVMFVPHVVHSRGPERSNCQTHLKHLGLACKIFSNDHDGVYPELSSRPGFLSMMDMSEGYKHTLVAEYVSDSSVLFCPQSEQWKSRDGKFAGTGQELLDNSSYVYLGYAVHNEDELETFYQCYRERAAARLRFNEDLPAPASRGSGGGDKLLRLREGVEKVYVTDAMNPAANAIAQSEIPVLIERPGNHEPMGLNIMYMDGHVAYARYPGKWPATPRTFEIIKAIESLRANTPRR